MDMNTKAKAIIITDLKTLQKLAMEKTVYHDNESARFRRQHRQITDRIEQMGRLNRKGKI